MGLISEENRAGYRTRIRVLLADDHPVVRWGLSCCLAPRSDLVIVGEAGDGREAVRKADELCPDIVLMDIEMPELNGLNATELLHRIRPGIKVLLLSMHAYTEYMPRILQSGARGFLLKDARPEEIVAAIHKVMAGETCFSTGGGRPGPAAPGTRRGRRVSRQGAQCP